VLYYHTLLFSFLLSVHLMVSSDNKENFLALESAVESSEAPPPAVSKGKKG
jgi:hypothetical protein